MSNLHEKSKRNRLYFGMKRITIKEIAKQAGVSIGTVDRVLHKRGEVSKKTTELVERIARDGNYKANVIARGLRLKRENKIAVLLPFDNEYWQLINQGISTEVNEVAGIGLTVLSYAFDRHNPNSFMEMAEKMLADAPDGVIMAPILESESTSICSRLNDARIPYLFVDSNLTSANPLAFIGQDSIRAGYLAAKLLTLGHPHGLSIYVVLINDYDSLNKTNQERVTGLKQFIEENKLDECLINEIGLNTSFDVLREEAASLQQANMPMHIFVPNSRANEVGEALQGVHDNLRIVGFDLVEKNRNALQNNLVDFIIDQSPIIQGAEAVRSFYKLKVAKEEVADFTIPITIYTKENI